MVHDEGKGYPSPYHRSHHPSGSAVVAELAEVDTLPRAEVQVAVRDGDVEAHAEHAALGMRRHVVRPFERVVVVRGVLRNQVVENLLHVAPHVRVGVLVDREGT